MISSPLVVDYPGYAPPSRLVVPSSLESRYAADGQPDPNAARAPAAQVPASDSAIAAWRRLDSRAKERNSAADVAVNQLRELELRARRGVAHQDVEELKAVDAAMGGIVDAHGRDLMSMRDAAMGAGPSGRAVATRIEHALDGSYRDVWGMQPLLDDSTEEAIAARAVAAGRDLGVDGHAARAIVDRNDESFAVYGRFAGLLSKAPPADPATAGQERERQTAYLRSVWRLDETLGSRFDNRRDFADFVSAFDQNMNAKGVSAGDSVIQTVANAYLAQKGNARALRPDEFVQRFAGAVARLTGPRDRPGQPGQPDKTKADDLVSRLDVHEAQNLVSTFVRRASERGVNDDVTQGTYIDMLTAAVDASRKLQGFYNINLRAAGGASDDIVDMALSASGVPGADRAVEDRIDFVTDRLSTLMSGPTRSAVVAAQGQKGAEFAEVKAPSPYYATEMTAVQRVGPVLYGIVREQGLERARELLGDPGSDAYGAVRDALEKGLAPRLGDLAGEVAQRMVGNLLGREDNKPMVTLEGALRDIVAGGSGSAPAAGGSGSAPAAGKPAKPPRTAYKWSDGDKITNDDLPGLLRFHDNVLPVQAPGVKEAASGFVKAYQDKILADKRPSPWLGVDRIKPMAESRLCEAEWGIFESLVKPVSAGRSSGISSALVKASHPAVVSKDPRYEDDVQKTVGALLDTLKDSRADRVARAEAAAGLLVLSRTLPDKITHVSAFPGVVSAVRVGANKFWPEIRQALQSFGVVLPEYSGDFTEADRASAFKFFAVRHPEVEESELVKTGYLDVSTGKLSLKNMLRQQQLKAMTDVNIQIGRESPFDSPDAKKARRVLSTFETEETATGRALGQVREHLLRQGYERDALDGQLSVAGSMLAAAWCRDGFDGVERETKSLMNTRRYFIPFWESHQLDDGSLQHTISERHVRVLNMATEADWEKFKKEEENRYTRFMYEAPPPGWLDNFQIKGKGIHRTEAALVNKLRELQAIQQVRARDRDEESPE